MNKQKFIDLLRKPHTATEDSVTELESVIEQFPYFQTAHIVLARGSKNVKHPKTSRRISSAAVYSTDRALLKKYINDHIIFLDITKEEDKAREAAIVAEDEKLKKEALKPKAKPAEEPPVEKEPPLQKQPTAKKPVTKESTKAAPTPKEEPKQKEESKPSATKKETPSPAPQGRNKIPPLDLQKSDFDADSIIDEMKTELEEYKKNKKQFDDWVQNEEERNAVEAALKKVSEQEKPVEEPAATEDTIEKESKTPEVENTSKDVSAKDIPKEPSQSEVNEVKDEPKSETKSIPVIEDVKPVEFKTASIPKPKSSGYSGKILIEGSNKSVKAEEPEEEPKKKERRSTKRVVQKVKKLPDAVKPEESKEEDTTVESSSSIDTEVKETSSPEPKTETDSAKDTVTNIPEEELPKAEAPKAEVAPKDEAPADKPTEQVDTEEETPKPEDATTSEESVDDEDSKGSDKLLEDIMEEVMSETEAEVKEEDVEEPEKEAEADQADVPENTESKSEESEAEIDDIPAPIEDDSTPDDEESFDLEVNDEKGFISREDDKFDIKKDKKRAGQLRKEKMRKLREQRGIIDEFIETDPQMPSPKKKKKEEEPATPKEEQEEGTKDLAAESQKPDDEMISENLAIIYKNQGKLQKAIEIYEKLILKFPKKEAYFAARIEELKKS